MTMPQYGNCPHKPGTWCIPCVVRAHDEFDAALAAKDAEIAALRERCERLREMALSQDDYRRSIETHHLYSRVGSTQLNLMRASHDDLTRSRNAYLSANAACNAHNDLQPPAGKESTDG